MYMDHSRAERPLLALDPSSACDSIDTKSRDSCRKWLRQLAKYLVTYLLSFDDQIKSLLLKANSKKDVSAVNPYGPRLKASELLS